MFKALLKTMRPRQWTKNVFVLSALVFDRKLTHLPELWHTLAGFVLFCLLSSIVYIINDLGDIEADRAHPEKCHRPLASGALPVSVARFTALLLTLIVFPLAYWLSWKFFLVALLYFVMNLAYSKSLKHIPLVDVLIVAAGFVLRVSAGVVLVEVERFSPWLYVVTTLLSLYIGFGKRRSELTLLAGNANAHRKVLEGYTIPFLDQLITIVSGTTIIAYSLYTFSAPNLPENHAMMLTIPFVIYGIFRYLYIVQIEGRGGSPEEVVLTDRPMQLTIVLWGIAVLVIFYLMTPL